jgi:hypothetical protein
MGATVVVGNEKIYDLPHFEHDGVGVGAVD